MFHAFDNQLTVLIDRHQKVCANASTISKLLKSDREIETETPDVEKIRSELRDSVNKTILLETELSETKKRLEISESELADVKTSLSTIQERLRVQVSTMLDAITKLDCFVCRTKD